MHAELNKATERTRLIIKESNLSAILFADVLLQNFHVCRTKENNATSTMSTLITRQASLKITSFQI